jgi:hypothetical protein
VVAITKKIEKIVDCMELTVNLKSKNGKETRRKRNRFVL